MPTTANLSLDYPTPLDPATADIWGDIINDIIVAYDGEFGTKTINQNFADKILSRPSFKDEATEVYAHGNVTGAVTVDITNGNMQSMTLTGNTTLTFSNPAPTGKFGYYQLFVSQNGTGGWTLTFPASCEGTDGNTFSFSGLAASTMTEVFGYTLNAGTLYRVRQGETWS